MHLLELMRLCPGVVEPRSDEWYCIFCEPNEDILLLLAVAAHLQYQD